MEIPTFEDFQKVHKLAHDPEFDKRATGFPFVLKYKDYIFSAEGQDTLKKIKELCGCNNCTNTLKNWDNPEYRMKGRAT